MDSLGLLPGMPPAPHLTPHEVEQLRVENVMRQASTIQVDARRLSEEEALLEAEAAAQEGEAKRLGALLAEAETELVASTSAVHELLAWREQAEAEASARSIDELAALIGANKTVELQVAALEEQLAAALGEARRALDEAADTTSAGPAGADAAYLQRLGQMIEEQEAELRRVRAATEELRSSNEAAVENETLIATLRGELEAVGADIPNAPMVHRSQRLVKQRGRVHDATAIAAKRQLASPLKRHHQGDSAPTSRAIELPLGVLRPLTERLGNLRAYASRCGVTRFAVEVAEGRSVLHCEGPHVDLDNFEAAVRAAAEAVLHAEGVVTFKDKGRAMGYDRAAAGLAELLMRRPAVPAPPPLPHLSGSPAVDRGYPAGAAMSIVKDRSHASNIVLGEDSLMGRYFATTGGGDAGSAVKFNV